MANELISAHAGMLIRKGATQVFDAFIDPDITKNFWFTDGSAKMELGKEVIWTWAMYNFSAKAIASEIEPNKTIKFDWYGSEAPTSVWIDFKSINDEATYVSITHSRFNLSGNELTAALVDSTGGFTMVLAGLKSYLEHGINLNLVADKSPI